MKYDKHEASLPWHTDGPTVFFWAYACGSWVGVEMSPGDVVTLSDGGPNDEGGYWATSERFEHIGESIEHSSHRAGRDCDGECSETYEFACRVDRLDAVVREEDECYPCPARVPDWKRTGGRRYDQYAEMAGY